MAADEVQSLRQQVESLKLVVESLTRRVDALERMTVDEASGGGSVTISGKNVSLRINSLTPSAAQIS